MQEVGKQSTVAAVIVTYASAKVIGSCIDALMRQTVRPNLVVVVDNCPSNRDYLDAIPDIGGLRIVRNTANVGFCEGNNIGYALAKSHTYVLFLNPDAFLQPDFIERALDWMDQPEHSGVGILTGILLGFDIE